MWENGLIAKCGAESCERRGIFQVFPPGWKVWKTNLCNIIFATVWAVLTFQGNWIVDIVLTSLIHQKKFQSELDFE